MARCNSYDLGTRCTAPARPDSNHCILHDPEPAATPSAPHAPNQSPHGSAHMGELGASPYERIATSVEPAEFPEHPDPTIPLLVVRCPGRYVCSICAARKGNCHTLQFDDFCHFPARRTRSWCINHDPTYAEQQRENSRRAARASVAARQPVDLEAFALNLSNRAGIQAAIDLVIRLELYGKISPARSRNILRALSVAVRNFDDDRRPPATHDSIEYDKFTLANLTLVDEILATARESDAPPPKESKPERIPVPSTTFLRQLARLRTEFER